MTKLQPRPAGREAGVRSRAEADPPPDAPRRPARIAALGEVVASSTTEFRAVAPVAFEPPPFGSFVRCASQGRVSFGVVAHVQHAPLDPSRRAIPLGLPWDELVREQPQVLELIVTEFEALVVAHAVEDDAPSEIRAWLPPVPPRVHDFVFGCDDREVAALTDDLSFVRTLASAAHAHVEELVAASIRAAAAARADQRPFLVRAGREVADVFRQDYERARSVLRRVGSAVR